MGNTLGKKEIYRVLDANFNRLKEGLRVCEDVCRFVWNKPLVTRKIKNVRHELTKVITALSAKDLLSARDIEGDVGKSSTTLELSRKNIADIFFANIQRAKESIRVLEEFTKLLDKKSSQELKKLRYQLYAIEKSVVRSR